MAPAPTKTYSEILRNDFCGFIHRSFLELNAGTKFEANWHIELLAAKLEEVRAGRCSRLIINVPPRHLKSHITTIAFPAWLLGHEPTKNIVSISYGQELADSFARASRDLMKSAFYRSTFATRLSEERTAVSDYKTTERGSRLSTSVSGGLTGWGGDIIIIDDPLKADEALSDPRRQAVNTWYDNTLRSRLNNFNRSAIIIVMQRLHADDLVTHVQDREKWDVVSLPALAEHDQTYEFSTLYGKRTILRKEGEALQAARMSVAQLIAQRDSVTGYNFSAQYQQDPEPPSGNIVKRDWLKFYTAEERPQKFNQIIQSWDTANKETELANFSVCTTWGRLDEQMYLLDVFRRKLEFPALKQAVLDQARLHGAEVVLIEEQASGIQLIQQLRAENFSAVQAAPEQRGDKAMRLRVQTAKIDGGFVKFPRNAAWLEGYLHELLAFPMSKNDDQVDSTVHALAWTTEHPAEPAITAVYRREVENRQRGGLPPGKTRMRPSSPCSLYQAYDPDTGKSQDVLPEPDGTFMIPNVFVKWARGAGFIEV
jgi:predicted phage terminase large subunit-like protein